MIIVVQKELKILLLKKMNFKMVIYVHIVVVVYDL